MTPIRCSFVLLLLAVLPITAQAQKTRREVHIIYTNGFVIKGFLNEKKGPGIWDPVSGRNFPTMSGEFYIDDHVRTILFTPGQVQKVVEHKPAPGAKAPMAVTRVEKFVSGKRFEPSWLVDHYSPWTDKGERTAQVRGPKFAAEMNQQIILATPRILRAITRGYDWEVWYFTSEFGADKTRDLVFDIFTEKKFKDLKDSDKLLQLATFAEEAGWYAEAQKELVRCMDNFPGERKQAQQRFDTIKQLRANQFVDGIKRASDAGQHQIAIDKLEVYDQQNQQALVAPEQRQIAQDLKVKYDKSKTDIEQVKLYLKLLPGLTTSSQEWRRASAFILDELNHDTVDRLTTFLDFAQGYDNDRKQKRKPSQSAEEVLGIAIAAWLQGTPPDQELVLKLAKARELILSALASDDPRQRDTVQSVFKNNDPLPTDVLLRLVRLLPPPMPHDAKLLGTQTQTIKIEAPDGVAGSYLVKLPPDYHHQRAYPVLLVMPGLTKTEDMVAKLAENCARNGYILAAPIGKGKGHQFTALEHALALDTLRDLRRRFQVDSDRVFLFGWEEGANMAFDVGLAHPDQFAGVISMNGTVTPLARKFYWPNAQYLPFYVIEGDRNVANCLWMRNLFKEWNKEPYAATFVEYKGRGTEWYSAEVAQMMEWMKGKTRYYPRKEMGLDGGSKLGEEFRSTRPGDSRFYWLASDAIANACRADHRDARWASGFRPATFAAHRSVGNKKDAKGGAEIWNQLNVNVSGVRQVTIWFTPTMMDLTKPLTLRVNGSEITSKKLVPPSVETILEELYQSGDRQRLMVAKIAVRL